MNSSEDVWIEDVQNGDGLNTDWIHGPEQAVILRVEIRFCSKSRPDIAHLHRLCDQTQKARVSDLALPDHRFRWNGDGVEHVQCKSIVRYSHS